MACRSCERVVPLLYRVAEGEASPEEAMRAARHLSDCTACRITLARERRLAAILDGALHDPLQVDEAFVRAVMDQLPQGPPPPPVRRTRRRLRLAL
jgi:anti-sigma factor RsiW